MYAYAHGNNSLKEANNNFYTSAYFLDLSIFKLFWKWISGPDRFLILVFVLQLKNENTLSLKNLKYNFLLLCD